MRTLTELRRKIFAIPNVFANSSDSVSEIPLSSDEGMNLQDGFPRSYAKDPNSTEDKGRYVQRNDMNRFGEIASRESVFKESGGVHTFSSEVSSKLSGYPEGALLFAFDGTFLQKVESTISENTKAFVDEETELVVPNVIDCPIQDFDDMVVWKSVDYIYGVSEGFFNIELDYSRAQFLPKEGGVVDVDSLVIGYDVAILTAKGNYSIDALLPMTYETNISYGEKSSNWMIKSKGKCGSVEGSYPIVWVGAEGSIGLKDIPYIKISSGTGNYSMSFFAKGGTTFYGQNHMYQGNVDILRHPNYANDKMDPYINWVAIPITPRIVD